jgi:Leucine-rich repeat (LRR) protein
VVLNLRENNFEGMLPSNITTECRLKTIDLHGNNIEGQLPRGLSNCTHLEIMDIGGNRIIDSFPSWLSGIYGLSVIVLRSNPFYGAIGDIVGDKKSEESFPSLQVIDLASNNFSGNLNSQWFEKLEMMMLNYSSSHERGHRYYNRFRSEADTFYHGYFDTMYKGSYVAFDRILNTSTTIIDLSNNRLEGTIPESIGRLVSLRFLNMSHNAFTGTVPAQLGNMTDLESLDHSCNKLTGEIPQELSDLTFLGFLNLSNNHLVGKIPQSRQFSTFGNSRLKGMQDYADRSCLVYLVVLHLTLLQLMVYM